MHIYPGIFQWKKIVNRKFDRTMAVSLWHHFFGPPSISVRCLFVAPCDRCAYCPKSNFVLASSAWRGQCTFRPLCPSTDTPSSGIELTYDVEVSELGTASTSLTASHIPQRRFSLWKATAACIQIGMLYQLFRQSAALFCCQTQINELPAGLLWLTAGNCRIFHKKHASKTAF